jgi:hypothetical protein
VLVARISHPHHRTSRRVAARARRAGPARSRHDYYRRRAKQPPTCLIQCIIESSGESFTISLQVAESPSTQVARSMSTAHRERAPWDLAQVIPDPQIHNSFRHQSTVATNRRAILYP